MDIVTVFSSVTDINTIIIIIIIITRPKPARQRMANRADIVGPGYSSSRYILGRSQSLTSRFRRSAWIRYGCCSGRDHGARIQFKRVPFGVFSKSHFAPPALSSDINHPGTRDIHKNQPGIMKNHKDPPGTMKN